MFRLNLHWQILIALGLAVLLRLLLGEEHELLGLDLAEILAFVGDLFLRALKMLVMPLIVASIIVGVSSIGGAGAGAGRALGRLGLKTAGYYVTTSAFAVLIGLAIVNAIEPGIVGGEPARDLIGLDAKTSNVAERVEGRSGKDFAEVLLRMVPENVLRDAAANEMLGVIVFAILFGFFTTRVSEEPRRILTQFWQGVYEVMLLMTDLVLKFAPLGVFALVAKTLLETGFEVFRPLLAFVLCVVVGLALHAFLVLPALLRFLARVSPTAHYRAMGPALLMAFSTSSSSATLPLTLECVQDRARVSQRVSSFTLPLGATVNMDGTALYECVAAMFIAQAYGLQLGFAEQFMVVTIALLTSIGVAGIPSASLVAISLILTTIGLPLEAVGLIFAVDRILDMCRTAVNVLSDSTAAVVIGRSEGEAGILASG